MQKIIKTTRYGIVSSGSDRLFALTRRLVRWLSAPPTQTRRQAAAAEQPAQARTGRRAGDPIGTVHFDGERLGGWPGEGRIR